MSKFEIESQFENLTKRVEFLENLILEKKDNYFKIDEILEDAFTIELLPESFKRIENNKEILDDHAIEPPKIFLTGQKTTGSDSDGRRWGRYSGTAWLQDNVGNKLIWYYIETGSDNICGLEYPNYAQGREAHHEARNTHICTFGWRAYWRPGQGAASSWGRFVDENGNGWRARWSSGC
ncbi:hypothetical protein [uncultured Flavobacterium sp.]|uniref:hypothetical protein n=1 Tax=uncultured Flavobacterium sp. TaxID=165435 RepID=UPI00292DB58B|nr:hypothetical protein [uncultured Flavobacterium sp.]